MDKKLLQNTFVVVAVACICNLLWGSAFPGIKLGYKYFNIDSADKASQLLFAGIRFMIAGLMVIAGYSIIKRTFIRPRNVHTIKRVVMLSTFQTFLQYLLFYMGLAITSGVKGSIIEGANVFVALFVSCAVFRLEKFTAKKIVGSIVGFIGIIIINLEGLQLSLNSGDLLIFLSTCAYAVSSVLLKYYAPSEDTVMLSGYQFLTGGIALTFIGALFGGHIDEINGRGITILIYLAFVSAVAYSLWAVLLAHNPVSKVAVMGFLNPVFGVILSMILLKESESAFGIKGLIALAFVCSGIYIVYSNHKFRNEDYYEI